MVGSGQLSQALKHNGAFRYVLVPCSLVVAEETLVKIMRFEGFDAGDEQYALRRS
jgi:hypothetical protein